MISRLYLNLQDHFNRSKVVVYDSQHALVTKVDDAHTITEWVTRVADEFDDHDYPVDNGEIEEVDGQIEADEGAELTTIGLASNRC